MRLELIDRPPQARPSFRATVPCKINLFLEVLGKRSDGYHELDTVMLAVSLCDTLQFEPANDGVWHLNVTFEDPVTFPTQDPKHKMDLAWSVPTDSKNLVLKSFQKLANDLGIDNAGGRIDLHKSIPAMAGLGGGSADAAAALMLGHLAWDGGSDWSRVKRCARELGSDINFFLEGNHESGDWIARCYGRGEVIEPLPASLSAVAFVLVHPPVGCSTAAVFSQLNLETKRLRSPQLLLDSLTSGESEKAGKELFNALEEPAGQVTDWISRARSWIDRYDHFGQSLSGSGSARFCMCANWEQAERIARELQSQCGLRAYAVRPWSQPGLSDQLQALRGRPQ